MSLTDLLTYDIPHYKLIQIYKLVLYQNICLLNLLI